MFFAYTIYAVLYFVFAFDLQFVRGENELRPVNASHSRRNSINWVLYLCNRIALITMRALLIFAFSTLISMNE